MLITKSAKLTRCFWIIVLSNKLSSITLPHVISFKHRNSVHMNINLVYMVIFLIYAILLGTTGVIILKKVHMSFPDKRSY